VNVEDIYSDEEPIGRRLAQGITKRLKKRKGKATERQPPKATKKKTVVGLARGYSKVDIATTVKNSLKRKEVPTSDSNYDVEEDVQNIVPVAKKRT